MRSAGASTRGARHAPEGPGELVRLRDGSHVTLRVSDLRDEPALRRLLDELGPEARRMRFFTGAVDVAGAAHVAARTGEGRLGLVAHDETGALVAHALYVQIGAACAEVAVEVARRLQDRGLGTILVERLARAAEERGIARFVAQVLPENRAMLDVFRDGFDARVVPRDGVDAVEFPTSAWRAARERFLA